MVAPIHAAASRADALLLSTRAPSPPRARVVIAQDDQATEAFKPQPDRVQAMVSAAIQKFTASSTVSAAWAKLLSTQDTVGIKVYAAPGPQIGTRPSVVEAVVTTLLQANIPASRIVVWDRRMVDLQLAGFGDLARRHKIRLAASVEAGWDESVFYESPILGQLVYGDLEFQRAEDAVGRKSFVTKLLTKDITKVINVSPLLNHNAAGVCGNLYSLALGSIDNWIRFENDPGKLSTALPDVYALPAIGDRVVLNIVDALLCQYQGEEVGRLHYSTALNQVRVGTDPVALDVLSLDELDRQRKRAYPPSKTHTNVLQIYRNAELIELGIADRRRIDVEVERLGVSRDKRHPNPPSAE